MKKLLAFFVVVIPVIAILVVVLTSSIVGANVEIAVTGIELKTQAGNVAINTSHLLEYEIYPKQASNRTVLFSSSDNSVATVSQDGVVSFIGFGTANITATTVDGAKTQSCVFNVVSDTPFGINLTSSKRELLVGENGQLNATVYPQSALDKGIQYSSSDEDVAVVDANGVLTAVSSGTVTLRATTTDGNVFQVLDMVVAQQATAITLSSTAIINETEFASLTATYTPSTTSESYKKLSYSSSNTAIATVSKEGKVVFHAAGTVDITASTEYGVSDTIRLYYTDGYPTSFECDIEHNINVTFDEEVLSNNGGKIPLTFPANSSRHNVSFVSTNSNVIEIDENGMYYIKGGGMATLTATVKVAVVEDDVLVIKDNSVSATINVARAPTIVKVPADAVITSDTYQINASVYPSDATVKTITYESLDESIATVDENGLVSFLSAGTAQIKAIASNGINAICKITSSMGTPTSCTLDTEGRYLLIDAYTVVTTAFQPYNTTRKDGVWSVEDASICSVDDTGRVHALSEGITTVSFSYVAWDTQTGTNRNAVVSTTFQVYKPIDVVLAKLPDTMYKTGDVYVTSQPNFVLSYEYAPSDITVQANYFCMDSEIAAVDSNGNVYFKKIGTARFYVRCVGTNSIISSSVVSVEYCGDCPKEVELSNDDSVIWLGEHIDVSVDIASVLPSDCTSTPFTLTQSKNLFAINGTRITANAVGTATITATFAGGLKRSFDVTVKQPVTGITLSSNKPDNKTFFDTLTVSAVVSPQNAFNNNIVYSTSDEDVATVNSAGVVTFKKRGSVSVIATAADGRGTQSSITVYSTFGCVESVDVVYKSILDGVPLNFNFYPVEASGVTVSAVAVSQNPAAGTDDVLRDVSGALYGYNEGTAVVNLTVNNPDGTTVTNNGITITVLFSDSTVTGFSIEDATLFEGDSLNIRERITDVLPNDINPLYVTFMDIAYDSDATAQQLTIANDTLTALRYGIYVVSVTIDGVVRQFQVTVNTLADNISTPISADASITASDVLSKTTELTSGGEQIEVLVTGSDVVELGAPAVVNSNSSVDITLTYVSDDLTVATVDSNGQLQFLQAGIVTLSVYQTMTAQIGGNTVTTTLCDTGANLTVRYYDEIQSCSVTANGTALKTKGSNKFTYNADSTEIVLAPINTYPKNMSGSAVITLISSTPVVAGMDVVTISNGRLYTASGGTAVVNITYGDATYDYTIEVVKLVETVIAQEDVYTVAKTVQLSVPTMLPTDASNQNYIFFSSDDSIASVTGTLLQFKKAGTVIIYATALDGSNKSDSFSVTSTYGGIESFSLVADSATMSKDDTYTIRPVVSPSTATDYSFTYAITSQTANNGVTGVDVISVNTNGQITALRGGTATVKVSSTSAFGAALEDTFEVTVTELTSSLQLATPSIVDTDTNGNYITAINSLQLSATVGSATATNRTLVWASSNEAVATVNQSGYVTFLSRGNTTISVTCEDNSELSRSFGFIYVANIAYSVSINPVTTTMAKGATQTLSVASIVPVDMTSRVFTTTVREQTVNNGVVGNVLTVSGATITATLGGTSKIAVVVNGVPVGEYDLTVTSPLTSITVESTTVPLSSSTEIAKQHQIVATRLPSDTDETLLYEVVSGTGVSVDANGLVTVTQYGESQIRVYGSTSTSIQKIVTITYSHISTLMSIEIEEVSRTALFGGQNYTLKVTAHYDNASIVLNNSDVTFTNVTPSLIASVSTAGLVTASNNIYGTASVSATYNGKSDTVDFIVAPTLSNMMFALNNADDNRGIKGERVFGTLSFTSESPSSLSATTNAYQMAFHSLTNTYNAPLVWTSSNPSVATVDNGIVTRLTAGTTTISCRPLYQYSTECATYTFKFVYGADVYNIAQYELFTAELAANQSRASAAYNLPAVLHTNITYTSSYGPNFWTDTSVTEGYRSFRGISNLYGNGYTIDASAATHSSWESAIVFQIQENDVFIDNVELIGCAFDVGSSNLTDMSDDPTTLAIRGMGNGREVTGVVIANSIIRNGRSNVYAYASSFTLTGCIIKNAYEGNVLLNTLTNLEPDVSCDAIMNNCVVENSLLPSIDLKVDKGDITAENSNRLTVTGKIYINNWRKKSDIPTDDQNAAQIQKCFDKLIEENSSLAYNLNGTNYVNFGITRLSARALVANSLTPNMINYGTVTESIDYLHNTEVEEFYYALYTYYVSMRMETYYGSNLPSTTELPGLGGQLIPGTVITSSVYPYIRDTSV